MLNDFFAEQAVRSKVNREFYLRMLIVFLAFLMGTVIFLGLNPVLGILVIMITIWLFIAFVGYYKVEYEYTLTNGSFEFAVIYKQSKRRELMHFDVEQIVMIVPEKSDRLLNEKISKIRNYTSKKKNAKIIAIVADINKQKQLILIEPNERVLKHIKTFAKNKCYDL